MRRGAVRAGAVCAAALIAGAPADGWAQLYPAADAAELRSTHLDVLAAHHERRTELVFRRGYEAARAPAALAWVIPVPSGAVAAAIAPADPFEALSRVVGDDAPPDGAPDVAAAYRFQRLDGRGPDAVAALERWLADGGFAGPPSDRTRYYAERGWSFVVARVDPAEGEALPARGRLPPVHVAFPSDRPIVPLRLEGPAPLDTRVFVWCDEAAPEDLTSGALDRGLVGSAFDGSVAWRALERPPASLARVAAAAFAGQPVGPTAVAVLGAELGRGGADPSGWAEDLSLPALEDDRPLTAFAQVSLPTSDEDEDGSVSPRRAPSVTDSAGCGCRAAVGAARIPVGLISLAAIAVWRRRRRRA